MFANRVGSPCGLGSRGWKFMNGSSALFARNPPRSFGSLRRVSLVGSRSGGSGKGASMFASQLALVLSLGVAYKSFEDAVDTFTSYMCGIVAVVSKTEPACDFLLEGLHILQNRGYDSAGTATITDVGTLSVSKFASVGSTSDSIDLLKKNAPAVHKKDKCGIAHTRWATHGGKTDANAHPHMDYKERIALVHNGTIENMAEIKAELQASGIPFKSQTDTEVIANLIGHHLDHGLSLRDAIQCALSRLEGTWGLAIIHKETPNQIIAARHGSPLLIGIGKDKMFVASEVSAFMRHTSQFIALNDNEVAVVSADGTSLDLQRVQKAAFEKIELSPAPFPHWTIKEIYEQPAALSRTLGYGGRFDERGDVRLGGLDNNREAMLSVKNLLIGACGTSFFASNYGARLMRNMNAFSTVQVIDAAEVGRDILPLQAGGMAVVSQSGETKDTHRALVLAKDSGLPVFSVVNQVGSLIARTTDCGVYLNAGREHAVASTKAFTTQVAALALISAWFSQNREGGDKHLDMKVKELISSLHRLPIYTGITLKTHEKCRDIAKKLKGKQHMFILGKGLSEPIAMEGALKIKEITYCHAEGFSGGALKHGPFALLEAGTPVVMLILDDEHQELMKIAAQETKARGTYNIIITDKPSMLTGNIADDIITIPSNGPMTAVLGTIPLQLIAYEMAIAKGINPDKPKNLAKAVTVD